jgi:hypothetical protein
MADTPTDSRGKSKVINITAAALKLQHGLKIMFDDNTV